MLFRKRMNESAIKPMGWKPEQSTRSARFTKRFLMFLLIALLMFVFTGCSKAASIVPMPTPPANLSIQCQSLPKPPQSLIDPERAIWEAQIIAKYGDCALRHRLTIDAWEKSISSKRD